jgi:Xaa-Pro dipeptidase
MNLPESMRKTPREELDSRTRALRGHMAQAGIEGALIVQNADLLYFAGTVQPSFLFIPPVGEPLLFVRKNLKRAREESLLKQVLPIDSPRDLPGLLAGFGVKRTGRLGMELDVLPVNLCNRFQKLLAPDGIADISPAIQVVRAVKSDYEIGLVAEAADMADFMLGVAKGSLREGMTELELAGRIESKARAHGHQGFVRMRAFNQEIYWGYLISGSDSALPSFIDTTSGGRGVSVAFPSGAGFRRIGRCEPVVFDLVGIAEGYHSDQTRTLCVGPLPAALDKAFKVSLDILHALADMAGPGVPAGELFLKAEQLAAASGLGEQFMGHGRGKSLFCGHGIGIELDELPVLARGNRMPLAPGMVFTIEPKFAFPGIGAVGVEDNFAVTEDGVQRLTVSNYDVEV